MKEYERRLKNINNAGKGAMISNIHADILIQ